MKSRSASVTGATGFVGWHVAEAFRDRGWTVRAIVRPESRNALPPGVVRVAAPLGREALIAACAGSDVIVHSAGLLRAVGVEAFRRVNVEGTRAAVEAANAAGARLIHISSQAVMGASPPDAASHEDDPPRPLTAYGRSKLEAEHVVRDFVAGSWVILRPASVYGPRDRQFLTLFRLAARGRFVLAARTNARFTLVHVRDVARAVLCAAESTSDREALFVGHPQPATTVDVLQAIADAVGRPYRPTRVPAAALAILATAGELTWRFGRTPLFDRARLAEFKAGSFVLDVTKARDLLAFIASTPLREGMAETARWYREQGWI